MKKTLIVLLTVAILAAASFAQAGMVKIVCDADGKTSLIYHDVDKGDTCWEIQRFYYNERTNWDNLRARVIGPNNIKDPRKLQIGTILVLKIKASHGCSQSTSVEVQPPQSAISQEISQLKAEISQENSELKAEVMQLGKEINLLTESKKVEPLTIVQEKHDTTLALLWTLIILAVLIIGLLIAILFKMRRGLDARIVTTTTSMIFLAVLLVGCGGKSVSRYGYAQPEQAISIPHPVEMEKDGIKTVTTFKAILDGGLWGVESYFNSDPDFEKNGCGVWPVLVEQPSGKLIHGFGYAVHLNYWVDFILRIVVAGEVKDMKNSKMIILNRDGGWTYSLIGKEYVYDSKKFDKDENVSYQNEVFRNGTTLSELQDFWQDYAARRGVEASKQISLQEVSVGSSEWDNFKQEMAKELGENYVMSNGERRQGYVEVAALKEEAAKNNGSTPMKRFSRNAHIPIGIDPITFGISAASSLLNGLVAANNGSIDGFYARAEVLRGDLKPNFRLMQAMFKKVLYERDVRIYELQMEMAQQAPRR